jgi:hypothetical protein
MKRSLFLVLAVILFIAPLGARYAWFYQGTYHHAGPVPTPDYASFTIPEPPLSTPAPVNTAVPEKGKSVVVDYNHGNYFTPNEIDAFFNRIVESGANLIPLSGDGSLDLEQALKYASAYISIAPTYAFSASEVQELQSFAQRGGRILVITDPTRNGANDPTAAYPAVDVNSANVLLSPFGMTFNDDYAYNTHENEGNFRNIVLTDFTKGPITQGINKVVFYAAHSLEVTATPLIKGSDGTVSSIDDAGSLLPVAALSADGSVLALGDLTFMSSPYNQVADNLALTYNVADYLLAGSLTHSLVDFPFLFTKPVSILPAFDKPLVNSSFAAEFGVLQQVLRQQNLPATLVTEPAENSDLVVIGTYKKNATLDSYLAPFNIDLLYTYPTPEPSDSSYDETASPTAEPEPVTVTVPPFGKVDIENTGIVIYQPSEKQNLLILLAKDDSSLAGLVDLLASGDISQCAIQGSLAVCSLP